MERVQRKAIKMMKQMRGGGLIYEENLKTPKTQSWDPETTSGNMITDRKYLKGITHRSEDLFSLIPKA